MTLGHFPLRAPVSSTGKWDGAGSTDVCGSFRLENSGSGHDGRRPLSGAPLALAGVDPCSVSFPDTSPRSWETPEARRPSLAAQLSSIRHKHKRPLCARGGGLHTSVPLRCLPFACITKMLFPKPERVVSGGWRPRLPQNRPPSSQRSCDPGMTGRRAAESNGGVRSESHRLSVSAWGRAGPPRVQPFFPPWPGHCVLGLRADQQLLPRPPEVAASRGAAPGAF